MSLLVSSMMEFVFAITIEMTVKFRGFFVSNSVTYGFRVILGETENVIHFPRGSKWGHHMTPGEGRGQLLCQQLKPYSV